MAKKIRILIGLFVATTIIGIAFAAGSYLSPQHPLSNHIEGEVLATSVSPNGRWKIKLYLVNSGASDRNYIVVTDQTGGTPAREIDFDGTKFTGDTLRWKSDDTVILYGQETNVHFGTVILKRSISPSGRWHVKVYDAYGAAGTNEGAPGGRQTVHTWAVFTDLQDKQLTGKRMVERDQVLRYSIRWKSANAVDLFGRVINVQKLIHGTSSR